MRRAYSNQNLQTSGVGSSSSSGGPRSNLTKTFSNQGVFGNNGQNGSGFRGNNLVNPRADPRNWFLSSNREAYNKTGKTRREKEQQTRVFTQRNLAPTLKESHSTPSMIPLDHGLGHYQAQSEKIGGVDGVFSDMKRHIMDFNFRPYVRPDTTRVCLPSEQPAPKSSYRNYAY